MKLIYGHVLGVADKGEGAKQYAVVAIQSTSIDNDGFPVTETMKLMVFGQDFRRGMHNAYRSLVGAEVFAPYRDAQDDRGSGVRYFLAGVPQKFQKTPDKPQTVPTGSTAAPAPAAKAG